MEILLKLSRETDNCLKQLKLNHHHIYAAEYSVKQRIKAEAHDTTQRLKKMQNFTDSFKDQVCTNEQFMLELERLAKFTPSEGFSFKAAKGVDTILQNGAYRKIKTKEQFINPLSTGKEHSFEELRLMYKSEREAVILKLINMVPKVDNEDIGSLLQKNLSFLENPDKTKSGEISDAVTNPASPNLSSVKLAPKLFSVLPPLSPTERTVKKPVRRFKR